MKIFLSWSGNESKQLAEIFKEWLPNVLQYVEPYMSSKDIALGERWNNSIADNLEQAVFGLIFVTPTNINAPWINFEAGALSKTVNSKVIPILYKDDVTILNQGPLKQFQSAKNLEEDSILNLLKSINESNEVGQLENSRLEKAFDMWWPSLKESIEGIVPDASSEELENEKKPTEIELLNVIYTKMIEQEKFLNKNQINDRSGNYIKIPRALIKDLQFAKEVMEVSLKQLVGGPYPDEFFKDIEISIDGLQFSIEYLERGVKSSAGIIKVGKSS